MLRRQQSQGDLGDHPECALAADEQFGQAQSGDVLQARAAQSHRGAVGEHHLQAEHVVGGDAVLHAAQPAGVGGDVPADAADLVGRRVRRVPQAVLADRPLHLGVEQAGLGDGGAGHRIDGDLAHPLGGQHDAAVDRGRAAGQAGAHPARHDRNPMCARPAKNSLYLFGFRRPNHRDRRSGRRIKGPVVAVGGDDVRVGDDDAVGQLGQQCGQRGHRHGPIVGARR